jgi:effector-binding domain-containing protein
VTIVGAEALTDSVLPEGVKSIFELTVPMGIKELSAWAMDREYALTGLPVGVFPDDPNTVPEAEVRTEIQWEVAPPAEGELETTERIEVKTIDEMMVAAGVYHGSYEDPRYEKALAALMAWPEANGYQIVGPFTEVYHSDPASVPPEEWKTEIAMPVMPAPPAEGEEATE